eukprot:345140-Chlamydomonas_euryale.AAC.5
MCTRRPTVCRSGAPEGGLLDHSQEEGFRAVDPWSGLGFGEARGRLAGGKREARGRLAGG